MAVKIRVQNFQSIRDATVEVEHLTVVTGANNSGKTALQRAAKGVFQNTPGTAFIRHGETQCAVTVDFGKDGKIRWSKGTGKRDRPAYSINGAEPLHPGSSVPDEIRAFGIAPIVCGGQEEWPNIAEQFTGQVFLLSRPGSALAEAVADVERVGQLNRGLRKAEGERRKASSRLNVRKEDLVTQEAEVASYEGLDDALESLDVLTEQRDKLTRLDRALDTLTDLNRQHENALTQVQSLAPVRDISVPDGDGLQALLDEREALEGLHQRWETAQQGVAKYEPVRDLTVASGEGLQALLDERDELVALQDRWETAQAGVVKYAGVRGLSLDASEEKARKILRALVLLQGFEERLRSEEASVEKTLAALVEARKELAEAEAEVQSALESLGACPTCGAEHGKHA